MDMATELQKSIQLFEKKNQPFYQTPIADSKDDYPFTVRSSNGLKSTSEKEPESELSKSYHKNENRGTETNRAFLFNSSEASRSQPNSRGLNSNRQSQTESEFEQNKLGEYNRLLDFPQKDIFDNNNNNFKSGRNIQFNNKDEQKEKPRFFINNVSQNMNGNGISNKLQHGRTRSLDNGDNGLGGGGIVRHAKKKSDKLDMMMIVDAIDEEDNILNNPFDKDNDSQGNLFNSPPVVQSLNQATQLINFSRNSSFASSLHNRDFSGGESQSTKPQNDINLISKSKQSTGKGVYSFGYETDEVESTDKSIDDKVNNNTQKSIQHQKRIKLLNLSELKTINEQSYPQTEDRSYAESWNTKNSGTEERKMVSNYLFNEREPLYQTKDSKSYIGSKNNNLVLIKMIERKRLQNHTQERMRLQYKQLVKKLNEGKGEEYQSQNGSNIAEQDKPQKSIVNILDYFQTKAYIYIVYEYLHQQSLQHVISSSPKSKLEDAKALFIVEQILNSLEDLQSLNSIFQSHGNLKIQNVFWDGMNIKLSDFCPTYQLAKQDISNYNKGRYPQQSSDVRALGIIYLQLTCGINAINYINSKTELANFIKNENLPRSIFDIINNSLFSETTSLSDFRIYINKNQKRLRKSNLGINTNQVNRKSSNTPTFLKSSFKSPNRQSSNFLSVVKCNEDKQSMIGSFLENQGNHSAQNASYEEGQIGKTKEMTFLKKYSYVQSHSSFELKINHLKVTKHKLGEEFVTNEQEFETNYTIPIFKNTSEEIHLRKRKNLTQLNYNPKYQWLFLSELDHLPYYERESRTIEDPNQNQYLLEGYYKLFDQRYQFMRCRDKKSKKNYIIKCINIEDDQEFNEILREIAISKYIENNIQPGIKVERLNEDSEKEGYQPTIIDIQSMNMDVQQVTIETHKMAMNYLDNLYREADKEVTKQFQGGIQTFIDAYIVSRTGSEFTFFLIFEDTQFSLKDFILKNAISLEDNPDKQEIMQSQIFNVINVLTKQIKQLKRIGITHNNIAPENILFQNCISGKKRIILSNFSHALIRKHDQNADEFSALITKLPTECFKYKSPEIRKMMEVCMQEKELVNFDPIKADIFSLGLCALELKFNTIIKDSQIIAFIENVQTDTLDGDLILYMIHFSSSIRFSDKEVLQYLKEETQMEKTQQTSLVSSPVIQTQTRNESFLKRADKKQFTQVISVQSLHRIQENQFATLGRNPSKRNTLNSLTRLPSIKALQSEQPEFKPIKVQAGNMNISKRDLFQYTEMTLTNYGDVYGGVQLLYQSKCSRMLYLFHSTQHMLESLDQKFLKSKQKFQDQIKLEYLILQEIACFRKDIYDYKGSVEHSKRALTLQSKNFVNDLYTAGKLQLNIAILDQEKNNSQVIYYIRSALDNYKEYLGNSSPKLVKVLTILGDEYAQKQQIIDALHQYQECMIITNYLGYQGPFGIRLLDKLGWAFFQTSDYQSSLKFFQKSTQIKERIVVEKDTSLAETYNNLGECYRVLNDQNKAIFYYEQSLSIILELIEENIKSPVESQTKFLLSLKAQVYNNLGIMYKQINKFDKAIKLFNESYGIKCQLFGSNSSEVSECLYNVAVIYDDQNQHTQAMQIYDQIIQQFKVTKDLDNLVYADCLHNKGICYYNINDFTKALNLLNEAHSIKRKKINNSVSLAITLQNLALVYHKLGQYKKSLQLYEEALKIFAKKLKPDHPFIFIIQENMKQTQRFAK